jgi:hypothetical protein
VNASVVALVVISTIVGVGAIVGFFAGARHKMDLEQWTVGNRAFGTILVWVLWPGKCTRHLRSLAPAVGLIRGAVRCYTSSPSSH